MNDYKKFVEYFDKFVEAECNVGECCEVVSSELHRHFAQYLLTNYPGSIAITNKRLTSEIKTKCKQFIHTRRSNCAIFKGLELKSAPTKPPKVRLTMEQKKANRKKSNDGYQNKFRLSINDKRRKSYASYRQEQELMRRLEINDKQMGERKELNLIDYVYMDADVVDWDKTLNFCKQKLSDYIDSLMIIDQSVSEVTPHQNVTPTYDDGKREAITFTEVFKRCVRKYDLIV